MEIPLISGKSRLVKYDNLGHLPFKEMEVWMIFLGNGQAHISQNKLELAHLQLDLDWYHVCDFKEGWVLRLVKWLVNGL